MKKFEPVLIRVWKKGDQDVKKYGLNEVHITDMILIFPTQLMSRPHWCNSYMVNGQHGDCDYHFAVVPNTRPATESEAKRMLAHYQQFYGYDVVYKVYRRWQRWFDVERMKKIEEIK